MNRVRLSDLDELVATIRDARSRVYITEAVNSYYSGAYRASIISTWIAVVSDIISKLRELSLLGDQNAKKYVKRLDDAIESEKIGEQKGFEDHLFESAYKEFEFISPSEYRDLSMLKKDRNLCAHPAFVTNDDLFQPEPERVRMHIVHAVSHLLRNKPIQGKSALERIKADIRSSLFPTDVSSVSTYMNSRYLDHAKEALVRNLVIVLLKALLRGDDMDLPLTASEKMCNVLRIVDAKFPYEYELFVKEKLPSIVDGLGDDAFMRVFVLVNADNKCWKWLGEAQQERLRRAIVLCSENEATLLYPFGIMDVEDLRSFVLRQFELMDESKQIKIIERCPRGEFAGIALRIFAHSSSYRNAEALGYRVVLPMIDHFTAENVIDLINIVMKNDQIMHASKTPLVLEQLFDKTKGLMQITANAWKSLADHWQREYSDWNDTRWKNLFTAIESSSE